MDELAAGGVGVGGEFGVGVFGWGGGLVFVEGVERLDGRGGFEEFDDGWGAAFAWAVVHDGDGWLD